MKISQARRIKIALVAILALSVQSFGQSPVPDTVISTGAVTNYSTPYHPAPYMAAGTLINSASSTVPTYAFMRYEFYLDATGKPAYAGLASVKAVFWHKDRYYLFADSALGGAGSVSSISSALDFGGGACVSLSKGATPHWEVCAEPKARRIPALSQAGTDGSLQPAFLLGINYSFNKPK